jgi:hypothetical protein
MSFSFRKHCLNSGHCKNSIFVTPYFGSEMDREAVRCCGLEAQRRFTASPAGRLARMGQRSRTFWGGEMREEVG